MHENKTIKTTIHGKNERDKEKEDSGTVENEKRGRKKQKQ